MLFFLKRSVFCYEGPFSERKQKEQEEEKRMGKVKLIFVLLKRIS